ncbi:MAG: tyrosine-type recombinase/integrase [Candidatus Melainabacteria bacterium]
MIQRPEQSVSPQSGVLHPVWLCLMDQLQESQPLFLTHLAVNRAMSANTVRAYEADLNHLLLWLPGWLNGLGQFDSEATGADLLEQPRNQREAKTALRALPAAYVTALGAEGLARATIARKSTSIRGFFKYMMKEQWVPDHLLPLTFRSPKLQKKLPTFLSLSDCQALIQSVSPQSPADWEDPYLLRNRAMLGMLFSSGLRVSELVSLNMENIGWEAGEMRVVGKGNRERVAFVSQSALGALSDYLRLWPRLAGRNAEMPETPSAASPLFLNKLGTRLDVRSVRRILEDIASRSGLDRAVHPHLFRHSFATQLLNSGVDLRLVQEMLGHASIRSTQIYTHVSTDRLKKAYMHAHPRARHSAPTDEHP